MTLVFSTKAWEQYLYWKILDEKIVQRINFLIKELESNPNEGIGKPEALKHGLSGYWSRRINDEHRLVYKQQGDSIFIARLRHHYDTIEIV